MKIQKFEDIIAWQKSKDLILLLYTLFRTNKDYSFKDQLLRAAVSIMNNIAEGFERYSNKELKNFLFIAKGSCGELRSMLYLALAVELHYLTQEEYDKTNELSLEISRLLSGFIKTL
ncbi:MAG TPA: four helix bundle protein [Patescibacteria group bacterium]|nr:four helix bundle protein [Patescibacteria group bacterium]